MPSETWERNSINNAVVEGGLDAMECSFNDDEVPRRLTHMPSGAYLLIGGPVWPPTASIQIPDYDARVASVAIGALARVSARGVALLMADLRVRSVGGGARVAFDDGCQLLGLNVSRHGQVTLLKEGKCTVDITVIRLARS